MVDKESALRLVRNPEFHQRTKHIEVKCYFIRDEQKEGRVDVRHVYYVGKLADLFTKPLASPRFRHLRKRNGSVFIPDSYILVVVFLILCLDGQ